MKNINNVTKCRPWHVTISDGVCTFGYDFEGPAYDVSIHDVAYCIDSRFDELELTHTSEPDSIHMYSIGTVSDDGKVTFIPAERCSLPFVSMSRANVEREFTTNCKYYPKNAQVVRLPLS